MSQNDTVRDDRRSKLSASTTSRRGWLTALGAASTLSVAGCVGGGGGGEPDFIRYLGWGGNTQDSAANLFEAWTEETGIDVEHQSAGGDSEFISIIEQNPGDIDIVNFSSFGISVARERDLLADIDFGEVPNYTENMQESFQNVSYVKPDEEGDTVFRDPVTQGYAYNTELVDFEMTSWEDLLDSSLEDRVALRDSFLTRFSNTALAVGTTVNEIVEDDAAFEETVARMEEENGQVFTYWGSGAEAIQFLREENAAASEAWGGRTLALREDGYDQMEYIIPEEGVVCLDENYNIPASSEKQDTVHDLINWSFQRENAIELTENLGYPIMINDPPESVTSLPDYAEADQLFWPDYAVVPDHYDRLQQEFQAIKES